MATRRVTRDEVARRAGTSTAVVSYVVNNGPRPVAEATRRRVEAAMAELGYRPNLIARALASHRTNTIGLIVPDISNAWFSLLAHTVERAASARGLVVLLGSSGHSADREEQQLETLANLRVDGLVLARSPLAEPAPGVGSDVPLVHMNHPAPAGSGVPSVIADDMGGARLATRHLLDHGHTEIACMSGSAPVGPLATRAEGWRRELVEAGLGAREELLITSGFGRLESYEVARAWIRRPDRPDAIFCTSDELALGMMRAATEAGVRIGLDLAIVGFDDIIEARSSYPGLTTMRQPVDELAAAAVDTLLSLRESDAPQPDRILPVRLVQRASCGC